MSTKELETKIRELRELKAFAAELPDVAERYSVPTVSRRFCVA